MFLFLSHIKHVISRSCSKWGKWRKKWDEMPSQFFSREHKTTPFPLNRLSRMINFISQEETHLYFKVQYFPCTSCEFLSVLTFKKLSDWTNYLQQAQASQTALGRAYRLTEVKTTTRRDYSRDMKSGFWLQVISLWKLLSR